MFYNNLIRYFNISYLKVVIAFSVAVYLDKSIEAILPLVVWAFAPFFALIVLLKNKDNLDTKKTRQKIERMY